MAVFKGEIDAIIDRLDKCDAEIKYIHERLDTTLASVLRAMAKVVNDPPEQSKPEPEVGSLRQVVEDLVIRVTNLEGVPSFPEPEPESGDRWRVRHDHSDPSKWVIYPVVGLGFYLDKHSEKGQARKLCDILNAGDEAVRLLDRVLDPNKGVDYPRTRERLTAIKKRMKQ